MEPLIGGIYRYNDKFLQVRGADFDCDGCYFFEQGLCLFVDLDSFWDKCSSDSRIDGANVKFVEVGCFPEKRNTQIEPVIGEVYDYMGMDVRAAETSPSDGCDYCAFIGFGFPPCNDPESFFSLCSTARRSDGKCVNFKYTESSIKEPDDMDDLMLFVPDDEKPAGARDGNYQSLDRVLEHAYTQASAGKGRDRHAADNPFEDQVICAVQRLLKDHPFGGLAFQVIKKTIEAGRLYKTKGPDTAYDEILGAINYLGGIGVLLNEEKGGK